MRKSPLPLVVALAATLACSLLGTGGLFRPQALEAAACGAYVAPQLCSADCTQACSGGGCCGWTYTYWRNGVIEVQ
jgi:hypothetical protein